MLHRTRAVLAVLLLSLPLSLVLRCPFALLLHTPCPGCGLSRATLRLLHGDIQGALRYHPLVLLIVPLLSLYFGINTLAYVQTGKWGYLDSQQKPVVNPIALTIAALTIAVWIARLGGAFGGPVSVR